MTEATSAPKPLAETRIVVLDAGLAGGYLGRLFADAGRGSGGHTTPAR